MGKIVKKRKLKVNRKPLYRSIAEKRKLKWAERYQLQHEEQFKFHFSQNEDGQNEDNYSRNPKNDHKSEQRIKNRVAAQESREKRKFYVQELEKKLKDCEQMLQTQTCKNCKSVLRQRSDSQMELTDEKMSDREKDISVQEYLDEEMMRVDNQSGFSPFAIFFFLCLIGLLTVFSHHSVESIDQRLLSDYDGRLHQAIVEDKDTVSGAFQYFDHTIKKVLNNRDYLESYEIPQKNLSENNQKQHEEQKINSGNKNKWKRYGSLLCLPTLNNSSKDKTKDQAYFALRSSNFKQTQYHDEKGELFSPNERENLLTCKVAAI